MHESALNFDIVGPMIRHNKWYIKEVSSGYRLRASESIYQIAQKPGDLKILSLMGQSSFPSMKEDNDEFRIIAGKTNITECEKPNAPRT